MYVCIHFLNAKWIYDKLKAKENYISNNLFAVCV